MDLDPTTIFTFAGTVLAAIIAGAGAVWVARAQSSVDLRSQVDHGVRDLIDQLQEERETLTDIIKRQRDELAASERVIADLETVTRRQRRRIAMLEDRLHMANLDVPQEPS